MFVDSRLFQDSAVLVTGGAGFIGSSIVDALMEMNTKRVVVLDNLATGSLENIRPHLDKENFSFIEGSIVDVDVCMKACENIDFVLHQAALGSVPRSIKDPLATHQVNSTGFINMLNAARSQHVKKVVFASSSSVYGDSKILPKKEDQIGSPMSPYAVSKRSNELYAKVFSNTYGMEIIGLRYFNIFGPRQNPQGPYAAAIPIFIQSLIDGNSPTIYGDGLQSRDFTYVENAVKANFLAVIASNAGGRIFNIAAGNRIGVLELFNILKEEMGSELKPVFGPIRKGDIKDSFASVELAKEIIGYEPVTSFREGLSATLEWFLSRQKLLKNAE